MLEKKGKGRGIKEVNSNVRDGNPDLMIQLDGVDADKLGLKPDAVARQLQGDVPGPDRHAGAGVVAAHHRRARPLSRRDPLRHDRAGLRPPSASSTSGSCCRTRRCRDRRRRRLADRPGRGPCRCPPWPTSTPVRTPDEQWRENQQPAIFVTAELNEEEAGLGSVVADVRSWMAGRAAAGRLPLGDRRPLPQAAGGVPQPARRHGRGRSCSCSSCWRSSSARWCCRC